MGGGIGGGGGGGMCECCDIISVELLRMLFPNSKFGGDRLFVLNFRTVVLIEELTGVPGGTCSCWVSSV